MKKMGDLIEEALKALGGEAHLKDIWTKLGQMPDAKEKMVGAHSRTDQDKVDMKSEIRCVIQRDVRFQKGASRGMWKLSGQKAEPKKRGRKPKSVTSDRVKAVLEDMK